MKIRHLASALVLSVSAVQAHDPVFPGLPSVRAVLESARARAVIPPAASARGPAAAMASQVRMDVRQWSEGSFSVYEPYLRVDLRADKIWRDRYDFRLFGNIASESVSGDARPKFSTDPSWGYWITGAGFNLHLDKFGDSWILNGFYTRKDSSGRAQQESVNYQLRRDFPNSDSYRVWEQGLDLRVWAGHFSASIDGSYDKDRVGVEILALLGAAVGIVNQPKLRRDPTRP